MATDKNAAVAETLRAYDAKKVRGNPDPKALIVAKAVVESESPDFGILFGSRARGDWSEYSDIDLLLVTPEHPSEDAQRTASQVASAAAHKEYGRETLVQVIWRTREQYRRLRRYWNSLETEAHRDGVIMPGNSEEFSTRKFEDDKTEYEHDWSPYEGRLRHAEIHLAEFAKMEETGFSDLGMGQKAQNLMEHSIKALIRAANGTYRKEHDIGNLLGGVRHFDPEGMGEFSLQIPPNVYSEYRGGESEYYKRQWPELTTYQDYARKTMEDAVTILQRAMHLRRNRTPDQAAGN